MLERVDGNKCYAKLQLTTTALDKNDMSESDEGTTSEVNGRDDMTFDTSSLQATTDGDTSD